MAELLYINGVITPTNTDLPTHDAIYGKGGYTTVADISARNNISTDKRSEGMLVKVLDDGSGNIRIYTLSGGILNVNWSENLSKNILTTATPSSEVLTAAGITSLGSGSIITTDERNKLNLIDPVNSAAFSLATDFESVEGHSVDMSYLPFYSYVYNIIDTAADLANLPAGDKYVAVGSIYYAKDNNIVYQALTIPTTIDGTGFEVADVNGESTYSLVDGIWTNVNNWTIELEIVDAVYTWYIKDDTSTNKYYLELDTSGPIKFLYGLQFPPKTGWKTVIGDITGAELTYDAVTWGEYLPFLTTFIPANESDIGIKGQYSYDSNYKYECVDTNTWVRTSIESTFITPTTTTTTV